MTDAEALATAAQLAHDAYMDELSEKLTQMWEELTGEKA
jgi:hypothetical protein